MYNIMLAAGILHNDLTFAHIMNDHHDKSSNLLFPYKVITILLTVYLMLYIMSL